MSTFLEQRQQIEQSYQAQAAQLAQQQTTAETSLQEQARQQASSVETQKQQVLAELYKQEELSQRQRALGQPFVPTTEVRAGVEQKAAGLQESTQAELEKALKSIKEQVEAGKVELSKWKQGSLASVGKAESELKAANVELDTGEWVPKDKFEAYNTKHQQMLRTMGVDKFNAAVKKEQKDFEAANVLLTTGEWTLKEKYDKLSSTDQQLLNQLGIDKFNATKGQDWEDFKATHIEIKPDVWYVTDEWTALTPAQQQQLLTTGSYTTTPATGEEALQQLIDVGKVPKYAVLTSYDSTTGEVSYTIPAWKNIPLEDIKPASELIDQLSKEFMTLPMQARIDIAVAATGVNPLSEKATDDQRYRMLAYYQDNILSQSDPKAALQELHKALVKGELAVLKAAAPSIAITIASIVIPPAIAAIPAVVSAGLASVASASASALIGAGVTSYMGYETVKNWGSMSDVERGVMVGLTALGAVGTVAAGVGAVKTVGDYIELRPTLQAAATAGQKYNAMVKTTNAAKTSMSDTNLAKLESATKQSISADLKFLDKFSNVKQVTPKQLDVIEASAKMPGLKKAVLDLIAKQQVFEDTLKSMKKTPITPAQADKLAAAREAYFKSLDTFADIAQPRYAGLRVPLPERTIVVTENTPIVLAKQLQTEWDAVVAKLSKTDVGSSEYYRLIDKQTAIIRRSYELLFEEQNISPELRGMFDEINRYNLEHPRVAPEPPMPGAKTSRTTETKYITEEGRVLETETEAAASAKTRFATAEKPIEVVLPEATKVAEPKTTIATEVAEKAVAAKAPRVAAETVPASAFPGLTVPKVKVSTRTGTGTADATELARMTPDAFRRLYGREVRIVAIGKSIPLVEIGVEEWISPDQAIREAQQIIVDATVEDINKTVKQLNNQGATQEQISSAVQQMMQQSLQNVTDTSLQLSLQTQVQQTLQTQTQTATQVQTETIVAEEQAAEEQTATEATTLTLVPGGEQKKKILEETPTVPDGTWTWKQGFGWRWFPPDYTAQKPYFSFKPPVGAKHTNLRTPAETIQIIGDPTNVPDTVSIDLGIVDIFLFKKPKPRIEFKGKGLMTEVGERIPGPTTGLSAPAINLHIPALTSLRLALGPFDFGLDSQPKNRKESKDSEPELRELTASLKDIGKL